jgi:hypothetical protein
MEIVIVAAWCICSMHNGITFMAHLFFVALESLLREELSLIVLTCAIPQRNLFLRIVFLCFSLL